MEEGEEEEEKEVEFWETDSFNACAFAAGGEERRGGGGVSCLPRRVVFLPQRGGLEKYVRTPLQRIRGEEEGTADNYCCVFPPPFFSHDDYIHTYAVRTHNIVNVHTRICESTTTCVFSRFIESFFFVLLFFLAKRQQCLWKFLGFPSPPIFKLILLTSIPLKKKRVFPPH